jgi:hypothetical protein
MYSVFATSLTCDSVAATAPPALGARVAKRIANTVNSRRRPERDACDRTVVITWLVLLHVIVDALPAIGQRGDPFG